MQAPKEMQLRAKANKNMVPGPPGRLFDLCVDFVLARLLQTSSGGEGDEGLGLCGGRGDDPHLFRSQVHQLPPDITHELLHRLLSSASSPSSSSTAAAPTPYRPFYPYANDGETRKLEQRVRLVNDGLLALLVSPHMTQLRLRMCLRVTDASFRHLFASAVETGVSSFALQEVSLDTCWSLTDDALHSIAKGCPSLLKLNLVSCGRFTSRAFDWPNLKALEQLRIIHCPGIQDDAFSYLVQHPSLSVRALSINGRGKAANEFFRSLGQMFPNLEHLSLVRDFHDPPAGKDVIQEGQLQRLRSLELGTAADVVSLRDMKVSAAFLERVLDALPQIEALCCSTIYDINKLRNEDAARKLKVLILGSFQSGSDEVSLALAALKRTAASLQVLSMPVAILSSSSDKSEEHAESLLRILANDVPELRTLRFPFNDTLLMRYLTLLQQSGYACAQQLHTLQLVNPSGLTSFSLDQLEKDLMQRLPPCLRMLEVRCLYGSNTSRENYNLLRAKYPQYQMPPIPVSWPTQACLADFGYPL